MTREEQKQIVADLVFEEDELRKQLVCLEAKIHGGTQALSITSDYVFKAFREKAREKSTFLAFRESDEDKLKEYPSYAEFAGWIQAYKETESQLMRVLDQLKEYGLRQYQA